MTNNFLCLLFIRRVSAIYLYSLSRPKERFIGLTQFRILFWGGSPQDAWNKHPERRDVVQTPITSICCRLAAVNLSCCAFRLVDNHVQCCSVGRPIRCTTNWSNGIRVRAEKADRYRYRQHQRKCATADSRKMLRTTENRRWWRGWL